MITLALVLVAVLAPFVALMIGCMKFVEWQVWDTDRRIARMRARRQP